MVDSHVNAIELAGWRRQLVIDGTDEYGNYSGVADSPPFAVFGIERQENLRQGLRSRRAARLALWFEIRKRKRSA